VVVCFDSLSRLSFPEHHTHTDPSAEVIPAKMARTGVFHHVGTFLLFAAAILLLITTISAPVIGDIAILKVTLTNQSALRHSSVTFGTFGHCVLDVAPPQTDQDYCYPKSVGYSAIEIMEGIDGTSYGSAATDTADGLTRVMILHPIACALAFIAFLFALGAGVCGAVLASLLAAIAWIITLVVMVTDFVAWGIVKDKVNGDGSGSSAAFSTGMWTILVAMILLFLATFIVLFTCFSARRHARTNRTSKAMRVPMPMVATRTARLPRGGNSGRGEAGTRLLR